MTACLEWARRREAATYEEVCVGRDEFPDGSYLSTVWIGLNHAFIGPPLIFETMYFSSEIEAFELPTGGTQYARPSLEFPDPHDGELTDTLRYTTEEEAAADRKSTRLNSSHLGISYAVFCLKKKTKQVRERE